MPASRSVVGILCLVFLLFVAASRIASATHFIGGTQHWVNDLAYNDPNNIKVRVTFEGGYRWSYPWPGGANPPVGTTIVDPVSTLTVDGLGYHVQPIVTLLVIGVVPGEDELYASGFVDLIVPRSAFPVSVQYSGCCRVSQLVEGNNDQPYVLKMVVDPTMGTRSPRSLALPRMSLVYGLTSTFPLPSASFDNLVNTFSFAPSIDSGLIRPIPGNLFGYPMQLTAAGMVTWRPQLSGRFGAQFRITSVDTNFNQKSAVPVDMEFAVVAAPAQTYPPFFEPGTPASLSAPAGQNVSFTISASGWPLPNISRTGTLPPGVSFTAGSGTARLSGTPTTAGTWTLTISAKNSLATVTQTLTIRVV